MVAMLFEGVEEGESSRCPRFPAAVIDFALEFAAFKPSLDICAALELAARSALSASNFCLMSSVLIADFPAVGWVAGLCAVGGGAGCGISGTRAG